MEKNMITMIIIFWVLYTLSAPIWVWALAWIVFSVKIAGFIARMIER